jgi:hypothetical protein
MKISVSFTKEMSAEAQDGRLLVILANNEKSEPRYQINDGEARAVSDAQAEIERLLVPKPADVLAAKRAERTRLEDKKKALAERGKAEATWGKDCVGMLETRVGFFVVRADTLKEELHLMEELKETGVSVEVGVDGLPKMGTETLTEDARVLMMSAITRAVVYPKHERVEELMGRYPVLLDAIAQLKTELRGRVLELAEKKG